MRVRDGVDDEFVDLQFVRDVQEFVANFFGGAYDVAGELGFGLVERAGGEGEQWVGGGGLFG